MEFFEEALASSDASIADGRNGQDLASNHSGDEKTGALNLPIFDILSTALSIKNLSELQEYRERERPRKPAITDPSYPHTADAQQSWVKAVMVALANFDGATDNPRMLKQWADMITMARTNLEILAWKFLESVMIYHSLEGRLEPSNFETTKASKWNSFVEHMEYLIDVLRIKKTLCRHLATDMWTASLIDAPKMHSARVDSNRRVNDSKKAKIDAGKAALQHVFNQQAIATSTNDRSNLEEVQTQATIEMVSQPTFYGVSTGTGQATPMSPQDKKPPPRANTQKTIRKSKSKNKGTKRLTKKTRAATPKQEPMTEPTEPMIHPEVQKFDNYFPCSPEVAPVMNNQQQPNTVQIGHGNIGSSPMLEPGQRCIFEQHHGLRGYASGVGNSPYQAIRPNTTSDMVGHSATHGYDQLSTHGQYPLSTTIGSIHGHGNLAYQSHAHSAVDNSQRYRHIHDWMRNVHSYPTTELSVQTSEQISRPNTAVSTQSYWSGALSLPPNIGRAQPRNPKNVNRTYGSSPGFQYQ